MLPSRRTHSRPALAAARGNGRHGFEIDGRAARNCRRTARLRVLGVTSASGQQSRPQADIAAVNVARSPAGGELDQVPRTSCPKDSDRCTGGETLRSLCSKTRRHVYGSVGRRHSDGHGWRRNLAADGDTAEVLALAGGLMDAVSPLKYTNRKPSGVEYDHLTAPATVAFPFGGAPRTCSTSCMLYPLTLGIHKYPVAGDSGSSRRDG